MKLDLLRLKLFIVSLISGMFGSPYAAQDIQLSLTPPLSTNKVGTGGFGGGSQYKKTLGEIILFVLILFIVFLFATSCIIANSNIQTQLKNGAYYGGLFASIVVILIVVGFIL